MLAQDGNRVTIIERGSKIGGKVNNWYCLFPDFKKSDEVINYYKDRIRTWELLARMKRS